jgi:hypothetical protein
MITLCNGHLLLERVLRVLILKIIMLSALHVGHLLHAIGIGVGNNPLLVLITLIGAIWAKQVGRSHARQLSIAAIRRGMHGLCRCRGQRVVPVGILICMICHLSHFRLRNIIVVINVDVRVRVCVIAIVGRCLNSVGLHTPSSNILRGRRTIIHDTGLPCRATLRCIQLTQLNFK